MKYFWKPCIIQFCDSAYGIRRFSFWRLQFVFKDFIVSNTALYESSEWNYRSIYSAWYKRGDCKHLDLDVVTKVFAEIMAKKIKPLKYNIITYGPDKK